MIEAVWPAGLVGSIYLSSLPGPGQFLYRKFKRIELKGWVPGGTSSGGGELPWKNAFNGLMPTTQEWWLGADGAGRVREVAGVPQFFTKAERTRWEEGGSRLPAPLTPNTSASTTPPTKARWNCAKELSTPNTGRGRTSASPTPRSCRPRRKRCGARSKRTGSK
jgi:hypothetical protein